MAKDILTPAQVRDIFTLDTNTGVLHWRLKTADKVVVGRAAGTKNGMGYIQVRVFGRIYLAHRLVWAHLTGAWPDAHLDHINRVRSDNRPDNLRAATQGENMQNSTLSRRSSSGVKGVDWHTKSGKWRASIAKGAMRKHLGLFADKDEAIAARLQAEQELFTHAPKKLTC